MEGSADDIDLLSVQELRLFIEQRGRGGILSDFADISRRPPSLTSQLGPATTFSRVRQLLSEKRSDLTPQIYVDIVHHGGSHEDCLLPNDLILRALKVTPSEMDDAASGDQSHRSIASSSRLLDDEESYDRLNLSPSRRVVSRSASNTPRSGGHNSVLEALCRRPFSKDLYRDLGEFCMLSDLDSELLAEASTLRRTVGSALEIFGDLEVFVSTFNVGNAPLSKDEFNNWLPSLNTYDLVAVGFQECDYKLSHADVSRAKEFGHQQRDTGRSRQQLPTAGNATLSESISSTSATAISIEPMHQHQLNKTISMTDDLNRRLKGFEKGMKSAVTSQAGAHLASLILDHLGHDGFFVVAESELMQMRLFVFARVEHASRISSVESASEGTGVGGVGGNKGGVAVCLAFERLRLCFVSAHLAAHRKYAAHRNRDSSMILGMLQRKLGTKHVSYQLDFDHVFFFGDLNSRFGVAHDATDSSMVTLSELDERMTDAEKQARNAKADHTLLEREAVVKIIREEAYSELMSRDQLRLAQAKLECMYGFSEASAFSFPPTFKVARESGYAYNSKRLPSYCDRILYYSLPSHKASGALQQIDLWSDGFGCTTSDHKPVSSLFRISTVLTSRSSHDPPVNVSQPRDRMSQRRALLSRFDSVKSIRTPGFSLVVSDLQAKGLMQQDIDGFSDPYVVLFSRELFSFEKGDSPSYPAARSKVKFRTLNPVWQGETLVSALAANKLDELRGKHFALSLWDFDTLSQDDYLGEVVFQTDDLLEAFEKRSSVQVTDGQRQLRPVATTTTPTTAGEKEGRQGECSFDLPVIFNGRQAGRMQGIIRLVPGRLLGSGLASRLCCWKVQAHMEGHF